MQTNVSTEHLHVWKGMIMHLLFIMLLHKLRLYALDLLMLSNCAPFIADLFSYGYERDFMSHLIRMFYYTSRYPDDIFTIEVDFTSVKTVHVS